MKPKTVSKSKTGGYGLLETAFLILPFLALIPNFFVIPDLTFPGLATQEVIFSLVSSLFALIGAIEIIRSSEKFPALPRWQITLFGVLLAFIAWQMVSLFWAPNFADGVRVTSIWFGFAIFLFAGITVMRRQSAVRLHYAMTALCAILAVSLLYERAQYGEVMLGIFFNHGITSELLATLLPLQIVNFLCSRKNPVTIISLLVAGLAMLALMAGLRRGAILGTLLALAALGILMVAKQIRLASRQRLVIVAVVILAAASFIGIRYREAISYRIEGATKLNSVEGGLTSRLRGWLTAWEMGKRNALTGVGNGGYPSLYGEYRQYFANNPSYDEVAKATLSEDSDEIRSPLVHNEYLQIFVELGIVGLIVFVAFWILLIRRLWLSRNVSEDSAQWVLGALLGLAAFSISSVFSSFSLRFTPGAFIVACLLSIAFAFARGGSSSAKEPEMKESGEPAIRIPKVAAIAAVSLCLIAALAFTARNYNVYASQKLHGRETLRTEALDFNYYPDRPADNERLERRYKNVLELDSENAGAHLGYGLLLYQMKRPAEAISHLEYGLKHGYNRPYGYVALAFAQEQAGRVSQASQTMRNCLQSYPQSVFARAVYVEMLRKEGKSEDAKQEMELAKKLDAWMALSWENVLRFKPEAAVTEARRRELIQPDKLTPFLAIRLVFWRAYHYL